MQALEEKEKIIEIMKEEMKDKDARIEENRIKSEELMK